MAYADPSQIRTEEARIRLNEREDELINAYVNYVGGQKGPLLREIILKHAELVLTGQADVALPSRQNEETLRARLMAA